jgi:hypothetical protein
MTDFDQDFVGIIMQSLPRLASNFSVVIEETSIFPPALTTHYKDIIAVLITVAILKVSWEHTKKF